MITVGIVLACIVLLLIVVSAFVRYLSETALIRMTDTYEATGEKVTWREGFRLGWSQAAFRIFLIDLVIGLGMLLAVVILLAIAAIPLLVWLTENEGARIIGSVTAAGLGVLVLLLIIGAAIVLSLLVQFMRRAAVLENLGVMESIRRGTAIVRQRVGDAVLMGLIVFALGLGWTILMIPVFIVLFMAGAVLGGLPGLLVGWIATTLTQADTGWIAGVVVGLPIFLAVVIIPALFLSGLFETFKSNIWTLAYREFLALGAGTPPAPVGVFPIEEGPIEDRLGDEGPKDDGLELAE